MPNSSLSATALIVSMFSLLVLAACGPALTANAVTSTAPNQDHVGPQFAVDENSSMRVDQFVATDEPTTGSDTVSPEIAVLVANSALFLVDGTALNGVEATSPAQQIALLKVEPIVASCCGPLVTAEEAVPIALAIAGVQNAALLDDDVSLVVQYDAVQVDVLEIASAIKQAAFFVTVEEKNMIAESMAFTQNGSE